MADHIVIGKVGRVTSAIAPGMLGEVVIPIRGGTETYLAVPVDRDPLPEGTQIVVLDLLPPRTVEVAAFRAPHTEER